MTKLQSFSPNTSGRDFICSDIHGHFSLLEKSLAKLNFDVTQDRLFCLGDLIDRGYESHLVIEYLAKPWFFSILGNHELMLIDAYESDNSDVARQWYFWGGDWAEDFSNETLAQYYESLVKLPMAIEIELDSGNGSTNQKIGLVHAELPEECSWEDVREELAAKGERQNSTGTRLSHCMLWNRGQLSGGYYSDQIQQVQNIDHVFHGHTIVNRVTTIANRTFLDLGSYKTGLLGIINPREFLSKS